MQENMNEHIVQNWRIYSDSYEFPNNEIVGSKGSAAEHVLYFKCHRKYCNGSASKNTNSVIFCDTYF